MSEAKYDLQKRFELEVEKSKLKEDEKAYMKRVIEGIVKSAKGRLYLVNNPDFQRYMTFRKRDNDPNNEYAYCVVDVMKNPDTGFTEGRQYSFYDVYGFNRLAAENKEALASELVNSANNYRVEIGLGNKPEEKMENETPEQACKRELKERISKMETVPEYKKQRIYDVLDAIDKNGKIKVVDEPEYLEHIAMRSDRGVYGYYLVQKMMDYSGSTQGRRFIPLNSKTLVAYVEEHKDALDKELRKRSQIQEK